MKIKPFQEFKLKEFDEDYRFRVDGNNHLQGRHVDDFSWYNLFDMSVEDIQSEKYHIV